MRIIGTRSGPSKVWNTKRDDSRWILHDAFPRYHVIDSSNFILDTSVSITSKSNRMSDCSQPIHREVVPSISLLIVLRRTQVTPSEPKVQLLVRKHTSKPTKEHRTQPSRIKPYQHPLQPPANREPPPTHTTPNQPQNTSSPKLQTPNPIPSHPIGPSQPQPHQNQTQTPTKKRLAQPSEPTHQPSHLHNKSKQAQATRKQCG